MQFELEKLRIDNIELENDRNREQKAGVLFRNLYNNLNCSNIEIVESSCQTEPIDHYFLFSTLLRLVLADFPDLQENVITQTKYQDLFWNYFEF